MHSKEAIDEVGCIHSTQGYDLNYAFIIMTIVCAIALACSMLLPNVEEK